MDAFVPMVCVEEGRAPARRGEVAAERRQGQYQQQSPSVLGPGRPGMLRSGGARAHATAELLGAPVGERVAGGNRVARPRVITVPTVTRKTSRVAQTQVVRNSGAAMKLRGPGRSTSARGGDSGGGAGGKGLACAQGRAVSPSGPRSPEGGPQGSAVGVGSDGRSAGRDGRGTEHAPQMRHRDVIAAAAAVAAAGTQ